MTFFVYDITSITGDQNNTVGFTSTTPVGYINQYDGQASGTYSFKLSQTDYNDDSIIIVKIGGTGVSTPDAKSYSLKTAPGVVYGDVNMDTDINAGDAILVMQYAAGKTELSDDQKTAADVSGTDGINAGGCNPYNAIRCWKNHKFPRRTIREIYLITDSRQSVESQLYNTT